ncbi:hypothetical protein VTH06DRAFT_1849 [Thermothelomyces fergusii]
MLVGFLFPLGVVGWLGKEDGVWSESMQAFVVLGVLLSVSVGLVRAVTGEGGLSDWNGDEMGDGALV